MTAEELREEISVGYTDYEFEYAGVHGAICPYNLPDGKFLAYVSYGSKIYEYHQMQDLLNHKILKGKSFAEVADEITFFG